jgi:hypothetical protein
MSGWDMCLNLKKNDEVDYEKQLKKIPPEHKLMLLLLLPSREPPPEKRRPTLFTV